MSPVKRHHAPRPLPAARIPLAPRNPTPDLGRAMILLSAERLAKHDEQVIADTWREAIGWMLAAALIGLVAGLALGLMLGAQAGLWMRGG